jgi:ATP-dependent Clp protease ATP-binding subunit ClpC
MNFVDFTNKFIKYRPVVFLEKSISHRTRLIFKKVLLALLVITFALASGIVIAPRAPVTGLFFLILFFWSIFIVLDAFYYSYCFDNEDDYLFEMASIVFGGNSDITKDFIFSRAGMEILVRLGVEDKALDEFMASRRIHITKESLVFKDGVPILESFIGALLSADQELKNFLVLHGVTETIFVRTCELVFILNHRVARNESWWQESQLAAIHGIGREWSYGGAYALTRWSSPLHFSLFQKQELHKEEVDALETILSKSNSTNVIIVGGEGTGKMEILEGLGRKIARRESQHSLLDKKILVFDGVGLTANTGDKASFERLLIELLNDAVKAGNIILVIPNLPSLVMDAQSLQVDLESIMSPFLSSTGIQIVAISDQDAFHRVIEPNQGITVHFETLNVKSGDAERILTIFEDEILQIESREGLIFTYPALYEAVTSASRYFVDSPLFDTANDLLSDAAALARGAGRRSVTKEDVLTLIKTKTGIPTGDIGFEEKERLQHLENLLHDRIVGQDEAIVSISDALRRARSGIGNPARPMGSFLFLGPTGVGKTETTKALAEIFFGKSAKVLRLDMSEYNTPDALNRLIGAFDGDNPGVLSSMLRENPYGVLLLDEFEKTDKKVLDLFLQILDEGVFSDVLGRKVSARNLIIIATSNAGSQLIFEVMTQGGKLLEKKDSIIEGIIRDGVFKPELLNRFDGVILFHPLSDAHLREVAKLMLKRLEWRLKERGINLVESEALLDFLVKEGSDPKFGARPLNRAIQDTVEKKIADKIIAGELKPGSSIEFSSQDLI